MSAEDKLSLYRDFQRSGNKSEVASKWGINRSYMYDIVKECEDAVLLEFSKRQLGRKPSDQPRTLEEAYEQINGLSEENRRLGEEKERFHVRSAFLEVHLKWAEQEAQELRAEAESQSGNSSSTASKNRKKHLKKKRKKL